MAGGGMPSPSLILGSAPAFTRGSTEGSGPILQAGCRSRALASQPPGMKTSWPPREDQRLWGGSRLQSLPGPRGRRARWLRGEARMTTKPCGHRRLGILDPHEHPHHPLQTCHMLGTAGAPQTQAGHGHRAAPVFVNGTEAQPPQPPQAPTASSGYGRDASGEMLTKRGTSQPKCESDRRENREILLGFH